MKRITFLIILSFLTVSNLYSNDDKMQFGFIFGPSTPNEHVDRIYNSDRLNTDSLMNGYANYFSEAITTGYHVGVRLRYKLSDKAFFVGGFAWHRFPENQIYLTDPATADTLASFTNTTNIIPLNAGINFYLFKSFIGVYGTADLTYNIISNTTDYNHNDLGIPIAGLEPEVQDSRLGFGFGAGVDFNFLFTGNLEVKYNYANLIGKVDDEQDKAFLTLSLGIFF